MFCAPDGAEEAAVAAVAHAACRRNRIELSVTQVPLSDLLVRYVFAEPSRP